MALFGFLDKKQCVICGSDIGAVFSGSAKISEGSVCKNCIAKLSPFFKNYSTATTDSIQAQLDYREANREDVAQFRTTISYGQGNTKLLIDEDAGKFMVTSASDLNTANPDVLSCSDVTSCNLDINTREEELKTKDKDGRSISYNPKRYRYHYDFYIDIGVNHPYASQIRFKINDRSVEMESIVTGGGGMYGGNNMGGRPGAAPVRAGAAAGRPGAAPARPGTAAGRPGAAPARSASGHVAPGQKAGIGKAAPSGKMGGAMAKPGAAPARSASGHVAPGAKPGVSAGRPMAAGAGRPPMNQGFATGNVIKPDPLTDANYVNYQAQGEEIKWALMNARQDAREQEAAMNAPKMAVQCACCGATTYPDASGCCEYCGGPAMG